MAFTSTNVTTKLAAVTLRKNILDWFRDIKALIQVDTTKSKKEALILLRLLVRAIQVFMVDEKANLFSSDKVALEMLQNEVIHFISNFEESDEISRLKKAKELETTAKTILQTN